MDKENIISFLCADVNIVAEVIEKVMPVESSELYQEMAFLVYDLLSLVLCYAICSLNLKTHALRWKYHLLMDVKLLLSSLVSLILYGLLCNRG